MLNITSNKDLVLMEFLLIHISDVNNVLPLFDREAGQQ